MKKRIAAIAGLTGIAGLVSSAVAGGLVVGWYDVNAFEGAPEFFVMVFAVGGVMAGGFVGLLVSLIASDASRFRLEMVAAASCTVMLALVAASTGAAWMLADIPPEIDGEATYLSVELRFPLGHPAPSSMPGVASLKLAATGIGGVRKQEKGALFVEDARLVDGQWTAPGIVRIFTSRGGRRIDAAIGSSPLASFDVPLPAHPTAESREWSEWLPRPKPGGEGAEPFTYRFKVVRLSDPLRVETFGRLTIETVAAEILWYYDARRRGSFLYSERASERVSAISHFRIFHEGRPLAGSGWAKAVAVLRGSAPTVLLVHAPRNEDPASCSLLIDDGLEVEIRPLLGSCQGPMAGHPLTSDPQRFAAAREMDRAWGWVDRDTFARPGVYQVHGNILDTRNLTVAAIDFPPRLVPWIYPIPLALSPDERSVVWFAHAQSPEDPVLVVTDWKSQRSYSVGIDRDRMRYVGYETLDPAWVSHHFHWRRGSDGVDILEERPQFVPLPYRGGLTLQKRGQAQGYLLRPAGEPLRDEVIRILTEELGGQRLSDTRDGRRRVRVDGISINVALGSDLVSVNMGFGDADPEVMRRVAAHLDAAWATGKYDALFRASRVQGAAL